MLYLLYGRLQDAISVLGESIPTKDIVNDWVNMYPLDNIGPTTANSDFMMSMGSNYLTNDSRFDVNRRKVKFVDSVTKDGFGA